MDPETRYMQLPPSVVVPSFVTSYVVFVGLTNPSLLVSGIVVVKSCGSWPSSHNGACALFDGIVLNGISG